MIGGLGSNNSPWPGVRYDHMRSLSLSLSLSPHVEESFPNMRNSLVNVRL
jgi:hypothetical protein